MRKHLLLVSLLATFLFPKLWGQTVPVLNGGFENYTNFSYPAPNVAPPSSQFSSSNARTLYNYNTLNVTQIPNGGGSAMRLETKVFINGSQKDTMAGYAIWGGEPDGLGPNVPFPGGFPFSDKNISAVKFDARYSINTNSPGMLIVQFKKNGVIVGAGNGILTGAYILPIYGTQGTFTSLTLPIAPALPSAPDTAIIAFTSNNPDDKMPQYPGDYLEVDNISFIGTTQTVPGGNLDTWTNYVAAQLLNSWDNQNSENSPKTTDAKVGNYAAQLPVIDHGGGDYEVSRLFQGTVIYDQNPPYNNIYIPGTPLSGKPQSLGFYNKYTSPGQDTAYVYAVLTKWNNATQSRDQIGWIYDTIKLKTSYQYHYAPIQYQVSGVTPDSAFIEFGASKRWPTPVVGSVLKLDEVAFHYCNELLTVSGTNPICPNSSGVVYTTQATPNSTYTWTVPGGASIVAGQGTNSISVNFGGTAGMISVVKTYSDGCANATANLNVTTQTAVSVDAGADVDICANGTASLKGTVVGASGGVWSGGSGTFTPSTTSLTVTYTPSTAERVAGSPITLTLTSTGNGTCTGASDLVKVNLHAAPTASAGAAQSVCGNNSVVALSGTVANATGGVWTSSGNGTFTNASNLSTNYTPSPADIASGSVVLTLTTTGQYSACTAVSSTKAITITPAPTVNAGPDQTVCANNPTVTLNGTITVASGGIWSGGSGTFSPSNTNLNATYTPTVAEITSGVVTLTLTTTGIGNCNSVSDQVKINITPAPTVNAGPDKSLCKNNSNVTLSGVVTVASGGVWTSSGSGTFTPNNTTLNGTYTPSAADLTVGSVTLTLTSTGMGSCLAVSDQVVFTFTPAPTVNAGPDMSVCGNNATVTLAGTVTVATGGIWSGGLGTFSPNATTLNATYTPSASEITAGTVTLTLTSSGAGNCTAVTDQVVITVAPSPVVNAGTDKTICATNPGVSLNGTAANATTSTWSGGLGTFSPNANSLTATYTPSASEIAAGSVTLTLSSTRSGCNTVTDQMQITITPAPTANAGSDITICSGTSATLSGSVSNASGGTWTTSGSGTFAPNNTTLNGSYTPSAADVTAGSVTLTLTTTGSGACTATSDAVVVHISTSAATANAGTDQTLCNGADANLSGAVTGANGGTWTSSGTGSFNPNANTLNATYSPSVADATAGSVTLTLTTTGTGSCTPGSDNMTITYSSSNSIVVNAGNDMQICNGEVASLHGTVSGASGGTWATVAGSGTFTPDANSLNVSYIPSNDDIISGLVKVVLISSGNGSCNAQKDTLALTITSCTGIASAISNELKVYPSPSNSLVNIETKEGFNIAQVKVMNAMQEDVNVKVLEMNQNKATVDLSELNSGMYFLQITDGKKVTICKIIRE